MARVRSRCWRVSCAALAQLRDLQLDLARARIPTPGPVAVALRRAVIGPALTEPGTDQIRHLGLHQLACHHPHRLADHIRVLVAQHLPDDLLDRHPVPTGHRRPPFVEPRKSDDHERRGGRTYNDPSDPDLHHATGRDRNCGASLQPCSRAQQQSAHEVVPRAAYERARVREQQVTHAPHPTVRAARASDFLCRRFSRVGGLRSGS
jgi:hypothetical protein